MWLQLPFACNHHQRIANLNTKEYSWRLSLACVFPLPSMQNTSHINVTRHHSCRTVRCFFCHLERDKVPPSPSRSTTCACYSSIMFRKITTHQAATTGLPNFAKAGYAITSPSTLSFWASMGKHSYPSVFKAVVQTAMAESGDMAGCKSREWDKSLALL